MGVEGESALVYPPAVPLPARPMPRPRRAASPRPRATTALARLAAVLLAAGGWSSTGWAWGSEGHRIVGLLADSALSAPARTEVARLLAGEPEPTLAGVSAWADRVRDEPEWRHTARWHWVNLPRENPCRFDAARDCPKGNCVVGAIDHQLAILADRRRPDAERATALKFVVHFVGDVHQPFHAGFGDDRGGNDRQLRFDRRGWNLHGLWDSAMVTHVGLAPEDYARQLRGGPALPADPTRDTADAAARWAVESCQAIFDDGLYPERRVVGRGYLERHRPLAERRLRQAGERLAAVLEDALGPPIDAGQTRR